MPHRTCLRARPRRLLALASLALALAVGGCRVAPPPPQETAAGTAGPVASAADQGVIARGYLERLRLGLGSPFRLIDLALADPRLDPGRRRETAVELLRRTSDGESHQVDPAALLPTLTLPDGDALATAEAHAGLIERVVAGAEDPRAGELAVRLAYRLAHLEGGVGDATYTAAVSLAAVTRDRELAERDARRLLVSAAAARRAAVDLVPEWRRARALEVERPALQPLSPTREAAVIGDLPALLGAVRIAESAGHRIPARVGESAGDPELARLGALADSMDMPPRAAIVGAIRPVTTALPAALYPAERAAWDAFAASATDEERFAAGANDLAGRFPALRPALARAGLAVAVGMRVHAQESAWYPGMPGPTAGELLDRYGIRVQVEGSVPERWVPFALRSLDSGLADLRSILPELKLTGLQVEITRVSPIPKALASHSPDSRTLTLPMFTGAGALAHEIAHDLDWQAARRSGANRGTYASDRALRGAPAFVGAVATLTPESAPAPARPAEIVARAFDWFAATRLAARGRWNGALSASQDDLLAGHAALRPPGSTEAYAGAVLRVLRPFVAIPELEEKGFLAEYGPVRWPRATLLLTSTVGRLASVEAEPHATLAALAATRDALLGEMRAEACRAASPLVDYRTDAAYRALVRQAAAARGRAVALELAWTLAGEGGRAWMERELYGPLWAGAELDEVAAGTLAAIAAEARALDDEGALDPRGGFEPRYPALGCGAPALGRPTP